MGSRWVEMNRTGSGKPLGHLPGLREATKKKKKKKKLGYHKRFFLFFCFFDSLVALGCNFWSFDPLGPIWGPFLVDFGYFLLDFVLFFYNFGHKKRVQGFAPP